MRSRSLMLAVLFACVGCRSSPPAPVEPVAVEAAALAHVATRTFGASVEGRPLIAHEFGAGDCTLSLLATIHGDEAAGTPLLEELLERRRADAVVLDGLRVVVVPVLNPDGLAADRRRNANGIDLNRNFPAANHRARRTHGEAPLSEPESRALHALLGELEPDLVVSIHQPVGVVDWDGPAGEAAQTLAAAIDLPAQRLGSRPGSLGSYLGVDLGVPVITLELPRSASRLDANELWERYGGGFEALADTLR